MSEDELKREIESFSQGIKPPAPNLDEVKRGGRRLLWRRRAGIGLLAVTAVAAGGVVMSNLPLSRVEQRQRPVPPAGQLALQEVPVSNPRVATFAVRAISQAGLLNQTGDFKDYQDVHPVTGENAWLVSFETATCDSSTNCQPNSNGDIELRVEVQRGHLVVTEATGPMSEEARQRLLSYEEQPTPEDFGLEFPTVRIQDTPDEGFSIVASELWRGPIPAPGATVECHVEVYDENGEVIYRGPSREEPQPQTEAMRAGSQFIFGIAPENLSGEPARADVICKTL